MKKKRRKLEKKTTIRNRLMRLWVEKVRKLGGDVCAVCGRPYGDPDPKTGKGCFLNAHHIDSRKANPRLRWDALNGILLCPKHHEFGLNSAHKGSIWFITWLMTHRWAQYQYVMDHRLEVIDVEDRGTLASIEERLRADPTAEELVVVKTKEDANEGRCDEEGSGGRSGN